MMRSQSQITEVPLKIVGGTVFGRYPKISIEQTYNMIISDEALVDYAGYKNVLVLSENGTGRNIYSSSRANRMLSVIGSNVFTVDDGINKTFIGSLSTSEGDVFISENNNGEIAITDKVHIYIYNYLNNTFKISGTDFVFTYPFVFMPGYITFQNGRFVVAALGTTNWVLSDFNNGLVWPSDAQHIGTLQTKPDTVQGAIPFPGRGNLLFVFGSTVAEPWTDVGARLFPYIKSSTFNVDYGCLNPLTIAANENIIVWLSSNEESGPTIMYSTGGEIKKISTDGIDFKLSQLTNPSNSYGYLFRQDGHIIYAFTFVDDNLSYIYDFNTDKFFTTSDENINHHIARNVVFFNNKYYFVSFVDGNLYEFGTQFTNYEYSETNIKEIPRIRICPPLRLPNQRWYVGKSLGFTIENGQPNTIISIPGPIPFEIATEGVDLSISRDGGETFGSALRLNMNPTGKRKSRFIYQRLGYVNDATFQLRFVGLGRFVAFDGIVEVRQ